MDFANSSQTLQCTLFPGYMARFQFHILRKSVCIQVSFVTTNQNLYWWKRLIWEKFTYHTYITNSINVAIKSKLYFMFVLVFIEVWKYNNLGKNSHDDKKFRIEPELLSAGRSTNVLASTSIQKPSCSLLKRVIRECLI